MPDGRQDQRGVHPGQLPAAEHAGPLQPAPGKDHLRQGQLRIHAVDRLHVDWDLILYSVRRILAKLHIGWEIRYR